jgi:hypothetical protein
MQDRGGAFDAEHAPAADFLRLGTLERTRIYHALHDRREGARIQDRVMQTCRARPAKARRLRKLDVASTLFYLWLRQAGKIKDT